MNTMFLLGLKAALIVTAANSFSVQITAAEEQRRVILVPGVREPEEMRVPPRATIVPREPVRMLAEATQRFGKMDSPTLLPALEAAFSPDFRTFQTATWRELRCCFAKMAMQLLPLLILIMLSGT